MLTLWSVDVWLRALGVTSKVLRRSGVAGLLVLVIAGVRNQLGRSSDDRLSITLRDRATRRRVRFFFRPRTSDLATILISVIEDNLAIPNEEHARRVRGAYDGIVARDEVPVILDIGANIGSSAVVFAETYSRARIVSFEPDLGNYALAIVNVEPYGTVSVVQAAVGANDGVATLERVGRENSQRDDFDGYRLTLDAPSTAGVTVVPTAEPVRVISPHTVRAEVGSSGIPFLLKVDIEGGERAFFEAVEADAEWWHSFPVWIVELHDYVFTDNAVSNSFFRFHLDAPTERILLQHGDEVFSIDVRRLTELAETSN
jgi:FkbM family methyltransferase